MTRKDNYRDNNTDNVNNIDHQRFGVWFGLRRGMTEVHLCVAGR